MTNSPSTGGSDAVAASLTVDVRLERSRVRRRRARQDRRPSDKWSARSRRRAVQTVFVCAGALLLMVAALYFTLSHEGSGPQGSERGMVTGARLAA